MEVNHETVKAGFFTLRLTLPADYKIPAHWHPADEHVTVLSGAFIMGLGDKLDEQQGKPLSAGGFAHIPPKTIPEKNEAEGRLSE